VLFQRFQFCPDLHEILSFSWSLGGESAVVHEIEEDENKMSWSEDMESLNVEKEEDMLDETRTSTGAAELDQVREIVDREGNSRKGIFLCVNKGQPYEMILPMVNTPGNYLLLQ